jgi:hypothetical protein
MAILGRRWYLLSTCAIPGTKGSAMPFKSRRAELVLDEKIGSTVFFIQ